MNGRFLVKVVKSAQKSMRRIPLPFQTRILSVLTRLEANPFLGKNMEGKHKGKNRIRVWPYRIVYKINKESRVIEVLEIDHKGHMSYD